MKLRNVIGIIVCVVILSAVAVLGLSGCGGDSGPTPGSLVITTTSLPEQTVNRPYSASVSGSGGALPYTWSVAPALPANLSLDTATGAIPAHRRRWQPRHIRLRCATAQSLRKPSNKRSA